MWIFFWIHYLIFFFFFFLHSLNKTFLKHIKIGLLIFQPFFRTKILIVSATSPRKLVIIMLAFSANFTLWNINTYFIIIMYFNNNNMSSWSNRILINKYLKIIIYFLLDLIKIYVEEVYLCSSSLVTWFFPLIYYRGLFCLDQYILCRVNIDGNGHVTYSQWLLRLSALFEVCSICRPETILDLIRISFPRAFYVNEFINESGKREMKYNYSDGIDWNIHTPWQSFS